MEMIYYKVICYFLIYISLGMLFFLPFVNILKTGPGFHKLVVLISVVCNISAIFITKKFINTEMSFELYEILLLGVTLSSFCFVFFIEKVDQGRLKFFVFLLSCFSMVVGLVSLISFQSYFKTNFLYSSSYLLISTLYFSNIIFSMILGHYYLVVPKLSERPLLNLHWVLWALLTIKILFCIFSIWKFNIDLNIASMFDMIMISMRLLWGFLAISVLSIFSYRLSKMRSIQSATGVMYVTTFFVLTSELIALYYFVNKSWML